MAPSFPMLDQDDDQRSGCSERMDVFRRCSISLAIRVSVECISPSLPEQWRDHASSLGYDPTPRLGDDIKEKFLLNKDNVNERKTMVNY